MPSKIFFSGDLQNFNNSKKSAVLEPRTSQFSRTWGLEAKDFKMCSREDSTSGNETSKKASGTKASKYATKFQQALNPNKCLKTEVSYKNYFLNIY